MNKQQNEYLEKLQARLNYLWQLANNAKTQEETQKMRVEAMKVYRELKKHQVIVGA